MLKSIVLTYGKALESFYNGWGLVSDWHCSSQARKNDFFIIFSPDFFMSLCWINRLRRTKHPTPCVEFDRPNLWQVPGVILQRAESRFRLILLHTGKKNWFFHHFSHDFFNALVLNKSTTTDYDGINIRPGVIKLIVLTYGKALESFYRSLVSDWHCSSQARKMIFSSYFRPTFSCHCAE